MNMATGLLAFGLFKVEFQIELWKCFQDETVFLSAQIACEREKIKRSWPVLPFTLQNSRFCLKAELTAGTLGQESVGNEIGRRKPQGVHWQHPWEQVELASLSVPRTGGAVGLCSCRSAYF